MPLPTRKTEPKVSISDLTVLLYGSPKVGKSTFCSKLPNALFLATEPGLKSLSVYDVDITCWQDMLEACGDIYRGDHNYQTVIIDTIDNAYRMCVEHVCKKNNVAYEGDLPYGKGYALVTTEFHRVITKLAQLPYGLWMVSHAKTTEVESRTAKYTKTVPTLHDRARNIVVAMSDLILYASMDERMVAGALVQNRVIYTKPNLYHEAGDRTGRLPEQMSMNYADFAQALDPFASDVMPVISGVTESTDGTVSVNITAGQPTTPTTDTDMADIDALDAILPKTMAAHSPRTRKQ